MFIVGIDVAKRSHEVCMITSDGQTVQRPFSIRNNCTGYNLMLEKIRKHTNIKRRTRIRTTTKYRAEQEKSCREWSGVIRK